MTIGEFIQTKLDEYELNAVVKEKNLDYNWVTFTRINDWKVAMNFANFLKDCDLVSIRGDADGSITCWF